MTLFLVEVLTWLIFLVVCESAVNILPSDSNVVKLTGIFKTTHSQIERLKSKMNCQLPDPSTVNKAVQNYGQLIVNKDQGITKDSDIFKNFLVCSVPCDAIQVMSQTMRLEWSYCPNETIYTSSPRHQLNLWSVTPRVTFVSLQSTKEGLIKKGKRDITVEEVSSSTLRVDDLISPRVLTIMVKPVTKLFLDNSFSFGHNLVEFHAVVEKNTCSHPLFIKETEPSEIRTFMEDSVVLTCSVNLYVHDTVPPKFIFCPGNRIFYLAKGVSRMVFLYDKPLVTDNVDSKPRVFQTRGGPSGEMLHPGRHIFEFVAEDHEHNRSVCRFTVRVVRHMEFTNAWESTKPKPMIHS